MPRHSVTSQGHGVILDPVTFSMPIFGMLGSASPPGTTASEERDSSAVAGVIGNDGRRVLRSDLFKSGILAAVCGHRRIP